MNNKVIINQCKKFYLFCQADYLKTATNEHMPL